MKKETFKNIAKRMTGNGFYSPMFGVSASWNPTASDIDLANARFGKDSLATRSRPQIAQ